MNVSNSKAPSPVLIAGGGPVGLTTALTLAHFGIRSTLVERNPHTTTHPKMDITNGRSMELFRRMGALEAIQAVATAPDAPFDVSWITTLGGYQLHRFSYGGSAAVAQRIRAVNDGTQAREAPIRASQILVEPALKALADAHPLIDVRFGVALEEFIEDAHGVTAILRRNHDGRAERHFCSYLVGCDGGNSTIRRQLGIALEGDRNLPQRFITHFRSAARNVLQPWGAAWHYQSNLGTLVAQNDWDTWTLLSRLPADKSPAEVNPSDLLTQFAGREFDHSVTVSNAWSPNLLVAQTYGAGRVFLAGDSAHQYIPTGGYGMNTGIGDAFDIAWKLAAVLHGFGGQPLLESYSPERRPIGLRNVEASSRHNAVRIKIAGLYATEGLDDPEHSSEVVRTQIGNQIAGIGNAENESFGIELGYSYFGSPVVIAEDGDAPIDDPLNYHPNTVPGSRLPSIFLEDGRAVYDLLGPWFTVIHFGSEIASELAEAANALRVPLKLVDLSGSDLARSLYRNATLLIRPDTHIGWRATARPTSNPKSILQKILGARHEA